MKKTSKKFSMQESYDIICEHYEHLKDSIREYVKEHADENGVLMLKDNNEDLRPYVITTQDRSKAPDLYTECRCVALRVIDGDVQFCAIPSFYFDEELEYHSSILAQDDDNNLWYILDWDSSNPFPYNIERIAYFLTVND